MVVRRLKTSKMQYCESVEAFSNVKLFVIFGLKSTVFPFQSFCLQRAQTKMHETVPAAALVMSGGVTA